MLYPQLLGYSINEIYTIKIDTQMMFPTIKINDLVNAVKVDEIRKDGLYVHINFFPWDGDTLDQPTLSFSRKCFLYLQI